MSAAATNGGAAAASSASSFFLQSLSSLGLGYAIAIALGFLVLFSALLLASYLCFRSRSANPSISSSNGVVLPRVIFVAEDDDDDYEGDWAVRGSSAQGLDAAAISSYPSFPYSAAAAGKGHEDNVCAVCLGEYKEGETLRMIPECRHCFHLQCVDAWLRLNASCPVCRSSPMPTPLSELVPLSHFPAGQRRR